MADVVCETDRLLEGKSNLLRFRQETWLSESDIQLIDRGIASLDRLIASMRNVDSSGEHKSGYVRD